MRLDHLLSKEHHEIWAGPHIADHRDSDDSLDGLAPVVGGGLVHKCLRTTDTAASSGPPSGGRSRQEITSTLLGFETTGPLVPGRWVGRRVVAPLWGWGVVFDLWIVVASINSRR